MAFVGGLLGHVWNRHSAQREESMRMLRWAVELASSNDDTTAKMGISVLYELIAQT